MAVVGEGISLEYIAIILGVILLFAKLFEEFFKRIGFPSFLGAILAGILIGRAGLNLLDPVESRELSLLINIGISFLLFIAGLEELADLDLSIINKRTFISAILNLLVPAMGVTLFLIYIFNIDLILALGIGVLLGLISVGPLTKGLIDGGIIASPIGMRLLIIGIISEVAGILMFNSLLNLNLLSIALSVIFIVLTYRVGKILFKVLEDKIDRLFVAGEFSFALIVSMILILGYTAEYAGFNAALISLLLGIAASNYLKERPDHIEKLRAFTFGFFEPLFFAGIGLYMTRLSIDLLGIALAILAILISLKVITGYIAVRSLKYSLSLLSKGGVDAALLLALYPTLTANNVPELYSVSLLVMVTSSILSSMAFIGSKLSRKKKFKPWSLKISDLMVIGGWVSEDDKISTITKLLLIYPGVVVVDRDSRPIGFITPHDIMYVDPENFERVKASEIYRWPVPIIDKNSSILKALDMFHKTDVPVAAVVDENGRICGVVILNNIVSQFAQLSKH